MNIVITGVRGFIGSSLARMALAQGHVVVGLDDESRGLNELPRWVESESRGYWVYHAHDCRGGIAEGAEILKAFGPVDAVFHLAAGTGSLDRPIEELRGLNVEMTKRVYWDAKTLGARSFFFPTTSLALAVPDSPYVRSKEEALEWLREEDRDHGMAVPVRFFNVMGAYRGASEFRRREVHIVPELVRSALNGHPFVVNGRDYPTADGTPSRDFVNVVDVCAYLLALAMSRVEESERALWDDTVRAPDGAVWLGTGSATTVLGVLEVVREWFPDLAVDAKVGPRRAFDCAGLDVLPAQARQFARARGGLLTPAWVGIRDEVRALLDGAERWAGL